MRRLLIFLSLLANVAVGQVIEDSLLHEILSLPNDTEKVNRLHTRGVELRNTDPALSYKYARLCEASAKNSASKKHLAKSYNQ